MEEESVYKNVCIDDKQCMDYRDYYYNNFCILCTGYGWEIYGNIILNGS